MSPRSPYALRRIIESDFPRLLETGAYEHRSPENLNYNCIAFAAGETHRFWWPGGYPGTFWPQGVAHEETIDAFVSAFESIGYSVCPDGRPEPGFEKVVLFAKNGVPEHAARQEVGTTMWLSKLGESYDIAHRNVDDVGGKLYGDPVCYLRRTNDDTPA